tara:strand:- start:1433 stop:1900 length:468 start_codon:yes stop_codon:yes gene_type:complete
MKYLLMTAAIMCASSAVNAKETLDASDIVIYDHTEIVTRSTPVTSRKCYNVEVPLYGNVIRQGSNGEVLGGAIIGGVIGNQFGNGSGKDAMTVLGAILGANSQQRQKTERVITGYNTERRCDNIETYQSTNVEVYSHSTIRFYVNGKRYVVDFVK